MYFFRVCSRFSCGGGEGTGEKGGEKKGMVGKGEEGGEEREQWGREGEEGKDIRRAMQGDKTKVDLSEAYWLKEGKPRWRVREGVGGGGKGEGNVKRRRGGGKVGEGEGERVRGR